MEERNTFLEDINGAIYLLKEKQATGELLDESQLATAYSRRGMLYFENNMFDESILDYDRCIEIMERLRDESKSPSANEYAKACAGRGMTYHVVGDFEKSFSDITKCIDIWEGLQRDGQHIEENLLFSMYIIRGGTLTYMNGNTDDAISDYRKSIMIAERLRTAGKPFDEDGLAEAYMGIAQSYDQKEEFGEANKYYDQCIGIWERRKSEGQPLLDESNLGTAYMNRGANYFALNDNARALSDHNKNIRIREQLLSNGIKDDTYMVSISYRNRALSHKAASDTTSAEKDYISALSVLRADFNERPELQEVYYDILAELVVLLRTENERALFGVLQEFLFSMRSVPKTEEAEEAQNSILEQLSLRDLGGIL